MKSIFTNTNIFNLSDPQGAWLFEVNFFNTTDNCAATTLQEIVEKYLVPTSVTLPSYHTEIVTKKWFGSEKSFPVIRTYGGDCTMNFDVRSNVEDNDMLYLLTQVNALNRNESAQHKNASEQAKKADETRNSSTMARDYIMYHPELENIHDKSDTDLEALKFHKIHVRLKNKTVAAEDESPGLSTIFEYNNCIITEFGFNEDLDYTSESKLTCKMTFHYDLWHKLIYPYEKPKK